jgi:hypothetical protein
VEGKQTKDEPSHGDQYCHDERANSETRYRLATDLLLMAILMLIDSFVGILERASRGLDCRRGSTVPLALLPEEIGGSIHGGCWGWRYGERKMRRPD